MLSRIEALVRDPKWSPRWGFHEDHAGQDRLPGYLPAIQQSRTEFYTLLGALADLREGKALQLGMGPSNASHALWGSVFAGGVCTIDWRTCAWNNSFSHGNDTHHPDARAFAMVHKPYSFLFIDAGHKLLDIKLDFANFADLVHPGGIIAFHDAAKRPGYEYEIETWRYLAGINDVHMISSPSGIGTAWIRRW